MAITVTMPAEAPTGITTTLVAGGSLEANTTYYYVMFANNISGTSPTGSSIPCHSPISTEGSFTTTTTDLSVKFNWTNSAGGAYYQILLTKTSGDYTTADSNTYGCARESMGTITDGTTGYTITAISTGLYDGYVRHSIQLANAHIGDIPLSSGVIRIDVDGDTTYSLKSIYDAVVAAGYTDNIFYDGYNFILKGWIICTTATDVGSLVVENQNLVFIRGGVYHTSSTFTTRFGRWHTNGFPDPRYGCNIDTQNCRYPFKGTTDKFQVYGCKLSKNNSRITTITEPKYLLYYNGGASEYITYNISQMQGCIIEQYGRGITSDVIDLLYGQGNNWGNYNHIRNKIYNSASMPYKAGGKFYANKWLTTGALAVYNKGAYASNGYYCDFYDDLFPGYSNEEIDVGNIYYRCDGLTSDQHQDFNYSLNVTVLDEAGSPLSGVTVNGKDKDGNPIEWIEHAGTGDKLVTGNTYTTDRTTDANGKVDYYTEAYRITMDTQTEIIEYNYNLTKTVRYPFVFTFSKEGYETATLYIERLNEPVVTVVTLKKAVPVMVGTDGETAVKVNPKNIGANRDKIIMT
jgi:hypothetical protein